MLSFPEGILVDPRQGRTRGWSRGGEQRITASRLKPRIPTVDVKPTFSTMRVVLLMSRNGRASGRISAKKQNGASNKI